MPTQPKDNNRPSLRISIPSSSLPLKEPYEDRIAAMSTLLHSNQPSSLTDSVGVPGNSPIKKGRVRVVHFSSSPVKVISSSSNPSAGHPYGSDQPKETPPNRERSDDTMSSLLNSYLSLDANAAHCIPSNHPPGDEAGGEGPEPHDGSPSVAHDEKNILERLFASHLYDEVRK